MRASSWSMTHRGQRHLVPCLKDEAGGCGEAHWLKKFEEEGDLREIGSIW